MGMQISKLFDRLSSHVTVWTWAWSFGGVVSVGAISGFVAKATAWIQPWGPIGWWSAALLGSLFAACVFLIAAIVYKKIIETNISKKFYNDKDRINPVDSYFNKKRVNISDMVLPFDPVVRKKTFENCELVGPCNVIVLGRTEIANCNGSLIQAACVKSNQMIINAVAFEDCTIRNCSLYQITFLVTKDGYDKFSAGMANLQWITEIP